MEHRKEDIVIPKLDLTGKVAVITGGTKGLGYGMSLSLAHYGADVAVASRTQADCERVSAEIREMGRRSMGVVTDVKVVAQNGALIEKVTKELGKVDIMICNAGIGITQRALELTEENWDDVVDTDLKAVFFSAQAAARQMVEQGTGGKIILIASAAAFSGSVGIAHYCAAKSGVVALAKALAVEWSRYGIQVNAVCPGYVPTSINEIALKDERTRQKIEAHTTVRRLGTIDEIASAVLFLCSEHSGYMNGTHLLLDGGGRAM